MNDNADKNIDYKNIDFSESKSNFTDLYQKDLKQKLKFAYDIKFNIFQTFTVYGIIESKDVIGTILKSGSSYLGQYSLEQLQQDRKIGRIDINISQNKHKGLTSGEIKIPVNLDKFGTSILAAGIECIEKIASFKTIFVTDRIEDCEINIKKKVLKNAKSILNTKFRFEDESEEEIIDLATNLKKNMQQRKYIELEDNMFAGDEFQESENVYVVEGAADIARLSSFGLNNSISCNGTVVPTSLIEKLKNKVVTLVTDQDRGGQMIREKFKSLLPKFYVVDLPALQTIEKINRNTLFKYLKGKYLITNNETKE